MVLVRLLESIGPSSRWEVCQPQATEPKSHTRGPPDYSSVMDGGRYPAVKCCREVRESRGVEGSGEELRGGVEGAMGSFVTLYIYIYIIISIAGRVLQILIEPYCRKDCHGHEQFGVGLPLSLLGIPSKWVK